MCTTTILIKTSGRMCPLFRGSTVAGLAPLAMLLVLEARSTHFVFVEYCITSSYTAHIQAFE